ncbi:acetyl-coenzyme A carboxylase carboxyl transferase subunit alpha [Mesosutterella multiformis]|uniref:Acetyl-coenzyme A carboxylase carboxyl transferase subunit alpha n=1 Tax=Mesosutterella multiformis TaxID=2259133 RepID=A0A388S945_9BURK|nr:acetyl-coenzyme A carboxylase carboxyl transferase subunit alpha [Mesosutterella multiformis]
MKKTFLDFEKDIEALDEKIDELRSMQESDPSMDIGEEVDRLEQKSAELLKQTYAELTPWQISQVARHPNRPYTLDYIRMMFSDFYELHGDRRYSDDPAIVGGLARLGGDPVMVIGHQKGRDIKSRTYRNFGMANPEGYRKALRLMKLAEKFGLPIITFVDTPGAYPGIDAEKHGQSEAIGRNLVELTHISVPVITTIIGEGGSGGALAIAVADSVLMLQYSTYSVISPEGCASILWKDAGRASEAANALALTADRLKELKLIDEIVLEPMGGAHRDPELMAKTLRKNLTDRMKYLRRFTPEKLIARRLNRIMRYGEYETVTAAEAEKIRAEAIAARDAAKTAKIAEAKAEREAAAKTAAPAAPEAKEAADTKETKPAKSRAAKATGAASAEAAEKKEAN